MRGLKKTRRIQIAVVLALSLLLSVALIGYALRAGIEYYKTPSELASGVHEGEVYRLGGIVATGSVKAFPDGTIRFDVTDGAAAVPVVYAGIPPDLFREGRGVIARGQMAGGVFIATSLLTKHDENYTPRELARSLNTER